LISPKVSKEVIGHKFPSSTVIDLPSGKDYMRIISRIMIKRNCKNKLNKS
jgi:hypothetical protein